MPRTIVVSDIQGYYYTFVSLLAKVNYSQSKADRLIMLGDYVDGGKNSLQVIDLVQLLVSSHESIVIGGNHDGMFINWLDGKDYPLLPYTASRNGGQHTIRSFCPWYTGESDDDKARAIILEQYISQINFLRNLPDFFEDNDHAYVHAGVNPELSDWRLTSHRDFRWLRSKFYAQDGLIPVDKKIIFGHEVCARLHGFSSFSPWFGNQIIGIDGGVKFGYQLNALIIDDAMRYSTESVKIDPRDLA